MACLVCDAPAPNGSSLYEIESNPESVGLLCDTCVRTLDENKPTRNGCGYHDERDPCTNEAAYGTASLMNVGEPGITTAGDSKPIVDNPLLCHHHLDQLLDGNKPDW